jgi:hypothetical protein
MKLKIEWVEVPAGEFVFGLSTEQVDGIRTRVREYVGYQKTDDRIDDLINGIINKPYRRNPKLTPEELDLLKSDEYGSLIRVERVLKDIPYFPNMGLDTFYISRYPITYEHILEFPKTSSLGNLKYTFLSRAQDRNYAKIPAMVSWYVADWFCQWIGARLPTATEWEKAARGVDGRLYPWGNEWDINKGNFDPAMSKAAGQINDNLQTLATPVDLYPSAVSPFDVWDTCGNVYEWTSTVRIFDHREGPLLKSHAVKHPTDLPWFDAILALDRLGGRDENDQYEYTGFRPVKHKWVTKYWRGWG